MSIMPRTRTVNPLLGTYLGIFASIFAAIFLLTLIFEELHATQSMLRWAMLLAPLALYVAIGSAVGTRESLDYFAAGRRVPAAYAGLGLAITAFGATGIVALSGVFFLIGFDAVFFLTGGLTGFVLMAVILGPYIRKFGAFTIPSYLGRRFDSKAVRLVSAALLTVPLLLLIAAELRMGAFAAELLTGEPQAMMVGLLALVLVASMILGGTRSHSWSGAAQCIAALLALIVPVSVYALLTTNLPLPQLTSGPVLRSLIRSEALHGLPVPVTSPLDLTLPDTGLAAIAKRFAAPFGAVGSLSFMLMTLTVAAGVAVGPWLLPRVATTPGIYDSRKSLGWATLFFGVVMLTIAAVSIFMRDIVVDFVQAGGTGLPAWLQQMIGAGLVQVDAQAQPLGVSSFLFSRDGILLALPLAAGLPDAFYYLVFAGIVAAALAASGAAVIALGHLLAEDVVNGLAAEPPQTSIRLNVARACLIGAAILGALVAIAAPTDPLRLLLWTLTLTASTLFPALVLSIWWKRVNAFGATAGMLCGFGVTLLFILACEVHWIGFDSALAAVAGMPAAATAMIAASLATPPPSRHVLELVTDMRVPGGEILYDREMRLLRLKSRERT
jgi:cation/acetate symporter